MTFSDTFKRALDAIDPDAEAGWTDNWYTPPAPRKDPMRNGLHVTVFEDSAHGIFICYGQIIGSEWANPVGDYSYEIQLHHSRQRMVAWGFHLEPASPEAIRMSWVKVEGGFPEVRA